MHRRLRFFFAFSSIHQLNYSGLRAFSAPTLTDGSRISFLGTHRMGIRSCMPIFKYNSNLEDRTHQTIKPRMESAESSTRTFRSIRILY